MQISIVIPAFNESKRLGVYLERLIAYCSRRKNDYEIIVVDDGSIDNTYEIASFYKAKFSNLYFLKLKKNRGKGYAVKRGLLKSKGKICIFMDADGSVEPEEIEKNINYILEENYDIVIGSRVLKSNDQILKVRLFRKFMGLIFNFFVQTFLFKDIKDTQCGFKMFRKEIVKPLFSRSHLRRFGFDIEILYLALKMGYKVKEVPISWQHVRGSKVNIFLDSIAMFFNILQVRNWHCTPINPDSRYLGPDEYRYMYKLEKYHWWFISHNNLVTYLIKSVGVQGPAILDVGCGTGGGLLLFSKFGKTFGIDASEQAVEFCRKRGLRNVTRCLAEKTEYADRSFDVIVCSDLLEHVTNPVEVLLEMKRILKDNGKIIITVPAFDILWSQHDEALCHLRRYNKESLSIDLNEAGLQISRSGYFFFTSFFIVAPIRIMRRFLPPKIKPHSDTTTLPSKFLNELLKFLFTIELKVLDYFELPFGTTLYAVVSK